MSDKQEFERAERFVSQVTSQIFKQHLAPEAIRSVALKVMVATRVPRRQKLDRSRSER